MRRPTVYLDTSTLSDAFSAGDARAASEHHRLRALVEAASQSGTLVLSAMHVAELTAWNPPEKALAVASWLDSISPSFITSPSPNDWELRWWMQKELGTEPRPRLEPISASLADASEATTPNVREIWNDFTVTGCVRQAHGEASVEETKGHALSEFGRLHADATAFHDRVSEVEKRQTRTAKFRNLLIQKALTLRLHNRNGHRLIYPEVRRAVDGVLAREHSVPFNRLAAQLVQCEYERIHRSTPDSNTFTKRYKSMGYDLMHLVGAAYCDVFTCDGSVDQAIGDLRRHLGRFPQLSVRGSEGWSTFLARLEKQLGVVLPG